LGEEGPGRGMNSVLWNGSRGGYLGGGRWFCLTGRLTASRLVAGSRKLVFTSNEECPWSKSGLGKEMWKGAEESRLEKKEGKEVFWEEGKEVLWEEGKEVLWEEGKKVL